MLLYIAEECGMPCFYWLFTGQMSIRTAEVRPYYFVFCFGRGTSVARRDHGGGLTLPESCRGYCRSRYDAEITRNRWWRQCITEDLPDVSRMYDWNWHTDCKPQKGCRMDWLKQGNNKRNTKITFKLLKYLFKN